jgi:hypothetical protein
LSTSGCRPETVELAYKFPVGSTLNYQMVSIVRASWDIGTKGEGFYRVEFNVREQVQSVDDEGAVVSLDLTRTEVEEDNFTPPSDSSFTVRVNQHGAVLEVIEVDGVAATLLEPEQRSLILTYRPLVSLEPVRLHEEWDALQEFVGPEFEQLKLVGRLEKLDRDAEGDFAGLSYTGSGPLIGTRELPEGNAELSGETRTSGQAIVDLEDGILRTASSKTTYSFDVNVVPDDASNPIAGTLNIEQDLELTKVPGS